MARAIHSDGIRSLSSTNPWRWYVFMDVFVCICVCPFLAMCTFVHEGNTHTHPLVYLTIRGTAGPAPPLPLPTLSVLTALHKPQVWRQRCGDYSGIAHSAPSTSPITTTSPHPIQGVLSVTISTSPSGQIWDIWAAAESPQVMQSEGKGRGNKWKRWWTNQIRISCQKEKKVRMERRNAS